MSIHIDEIITEVTPGVAQEPAPNPQDNAQEQSQALGEHLLLRHLQRLHIRQLRLMED